MRKTVEIIGAPTDYGTSRRGVDMGPSAIRYAGLSQQLADADVECLDGGDLHVRRAEETLSSDPREVDDAPVSPARYLPEIEDVCARLSERVATARGDGRLPLVLGGDHSIAIGTLRGLDLSLEGSIGVLWFDAHGDFNTPSTTPSGNVHGMSLAASLGLGEFAEIEWARAEAVAPEHVALVGLRDLDSGERDSITASPVTPFTMADIDRRGLRSVLDEALEVAGHGVDALHVSLDMDWLDPNVAPGVGTPVRGGVTYREAHSAMEAVATHTEETQLLSSLEVVEVNPTLDRHNETAELAAELLASAMGKRVL